MTQPWHLLGLLTRWCSRKKGCKLNWKLSVSSCQNQQSSFTLSQAECHVCYNIKCGYLFNVTAGAFTVCLASCLDCPSTCYCCCCKYCQGVTSQVNFGHPLLRACLAVCLPEMRLWTASNRSAVKEPKANSLVCVAAKWVSLEMNVQLALPLSLSICQLPAGIKAFWLRLDGHAGVCVCVCPSDGWVWPFGF